MRDNRARRVKWRSTDARGCFDKPLSRWSQTAGVLHAPGLRRKGFEHASSELIGCRKSARTFERSRWFSALAYCEPKRSDRAVSVHRGETRCYKLLGNRSFRNLWLANLLSMMGSQVSRIGLILYVFNTSDAVSIWRCWWRSTRCPARWSRPSPARG